ncbi:MAG TPA: ribosome biogenesis GTPase YlqF [Kofleriaceae bacterium]|nr:ribosome biogenesis GTPase YlqF [Kofleriaceae bacterium]
MALQWYPGHMTKARRELAALMPSQDLVIEVIDARLPAASTNPVVAELRGARPCLKVLTKGDLADPAVTRAWLDALAREDRVAAFAPAIDRPKDTRKRIAELAARLGLVHAPHRPLRALIAGVPNAGKSTLINVLMDRAVAKTGDRPAVTKVQQRVVLPGGMIVTDSPGLMWPKIEDEAAALRLALAGSIPDTAIDYLTVGMFGARFLLERYPALVAARYKLAQPPATAEALLHEIGRRRGGLRAGGTVDLHKAAEILVHEFRQGVLGRISLEAPPPARDAA